MYKILIIALKCYFNNKCILKEKIQKVLLVKYISTSVFFIITNSDQQIKNSYKCTSYSTDTDHLIKQQN